MSAVPEPMNGSKPSWRDLREAEDRVMHALNEHKVETEGKFTRAHDYHKDANDDIGRCLKEVEGRVDRIESILDQLRGISKVVYFIGFGQLLLIAGWAYTTFANPPT